MKTTYHLLLVFVITVLAAPSCNTEKHDLRFRPGGVMDKNLHLKLSGHVNLDIPIAKVDEDFSTDITTLLHYDSTAAGNTMVFQYQSLTNGEKRDTGSQGITLSKGVETMGPMSAFTLSSFTTTVDAEGKSGSVSGIDSFAAAINRTIQAEVKTDNPEAVKMLQVDSLLKDGTLTAIIDMTQHVLPGKPVAIGDSWEHSNVFTPGFSLRMVSRYTLEAIEGDTAFISMTSGIDQPDPNESLSTAGIAWFLPEVQKTAKEVPATLWSAMAKNIQVNVKGSMTGNIRVNKNTGILIDSKLKQKLEGEIKMSTFSIPVKLDMQYDYRME